jgi:secreted PhoX family phosphatase
MIEKNDSLQTRREFLTFFGRAALAASIVGLHPLEALSTPATRPALPFSPVQPNTKDTFQTASGFQTQILARWGDVINQKGEKFGYNNDFTSFMSINGSEDGLLWVNHESSHRVFVSGMKPGDSLKKEHILRQMPSVGGSLLRVKKNSKGQWEIDLHDKRNRRFHARTPIPLNAPRPIVGSKIAAGTLANCSGGQTPWGTFLTCEENYEKFYGQAVYPNGQRKIETRLAKYKWNQFFQEPPEHYGWVVEINPQTGAAQKLTAMGRFSHEGAAVVTAADGRCVAYMGDDASNQCLYKFVASKKGSLAEGELFVANVKAGRWESLQWSKRKVLQKHFKDQTEVLIRTREAARLVGGTPMDRPEGIQVDPVTKSIYVSLTNNKSKGNLFGSIFRVDEQSGDFRSTRFRSATFLPGGSKHGFACPDNLAFDPAGNLWMTTDISGSSIGKGPYKPFGHNGLFCIPLRGRYAGMVIRVATGPVDAELTGMSFTPDGKTLFLSVQHPGERTRELKKMTSHWPDGGNAIPKPAVVAISGPSLEALQKR